MRYVLSFGILLLVSVSAIVMWRGRAFAPSPIAEAGSLSASPVATVVQAVAADAVEVELAKNPTLACGDCCGGGAIGVSPTPPVVCQLSESALADRVTKFRTTLLPLVQETTELDDGYAFRFAPGDDVLRNLVDWVAVERQCCRFFRFRLTVEMDEGPFWFEVTGPGGAKELLASTMRPAD